MSLPVESPESSTSKYSTLAVVAAVLWGGLVAAGSVVGSWYENTPAAAHEVVDQWPAETACGLATTRPTLLMFIHPRCPCSRSSISELAVLMTRCEGRVDAQVLFLCPTSTSRDWAKTDLWESVRRIPGVASRMDFDGVEHRRFGARNSGEVFLFAPGGERLFHGGITAGRGHAGDNAGRAALEAILWNQDSPVRTTPVFGCELNCPSPQTQVTHTAVADAKDGR
ncbi:thioredoxin domain-containing protein [Candidatus Laterigemmans baculatus]|uniref:hypothetical protein n=1 Tax=Candidatus Laterigemmans baculatus TaxID=2770505 RepID=UPI0013DAC75A|nr:hypothetical protein [Candidatus Laterigemmans baculatus]